jgi:MFS family permease
MALQMTSFVIILPLFARRFGELGLGVEALGISALVYALAATVAAPFMGSLADRYGRRWLVLLSLSAYALAFIGYRFAASGPAFVAIRALAGALTAGLIPAVTGIVADVAPRERRGQWIGFANGGASIGWIAGPILGGMLYDRWGYGVATSVSVLMALAALALAYLMVPEAHTQRKQPSEAGTAAPSLRLTGSRAALQSFRDTLPRSLSTFLALLGISFTVVFAWAYIEPKFMFYAYDDLGWSASMLGLVMSTFGIAMAVGEFGLGRLSDRVGRNPVIVLGVVLFMAQFIGLAVFQNYLLIMVCFLIAGLGNALFDPAIGASILDIAPAEHQARNLGLRSTAASLGNILGPGLLVITTGVLEPRGVFLAATGIVCLGIAWLWFVQGRARPIHVQRGELSKESTVNAK